MTLYMIIGISGSGKTTYARHFCQVHPGVMYAGSDYLRSVYGSGEDDQSVSHKVFAEIERLVHNHLEVGWDILIDATLLNRKARKKFIKIALQFDAPIEVYVMDTPLNLCLERNATRKRVVPDEIIRNQAKRFSPPVQGDGEVDKVYYVKPNEV